MSAPNIYQSAIDRVISQTRLGDTELRFIHGDVITRLRAQAPVGSDMMAQHAYALDRFLTQNQLAIAGTTEEKAGAARELEEGRGHSLKFGSRKTGGRVTLMIIGIPRVDSLAECTRNAPGPTAALIPILKRCFKHDPAAVRLGVLLHEVGHKFSSDEAVADIAGMQLFESMTRDKTFFRDFLHWRAICTLANPDVAGGSEQYGLQMVIALKRALDGPREPDILANCRKIIGGIGLLPHRAAVKQSIAKIIGHQTISFATFNELAQAARTLGARHPQWSEMRDLCAVYDQAFTAFAKRWPHRLDAAAQPPHVGTSMSYSLNWQIRPRSPKL